MGWRAPVVVIEGPTGNISRRLSEAGLVVEAFSSRAEEGELERAVESGVVVVDASALSDRVRALLDGVRGSVVLVRSPDSERPVREEPADFLVHEDGSDTESLASVVRAAGRLAEARRELGLRDELLRVLLHDLRDPLSALSIAARLDGARDDEAWRERDAVLLRQAEQLESLVESAGELAKLASGRSWVSRRRVDLGQLVSECLEQHGRGEALALETDRPVPVAIDESRFCRALDAFLREALADASSSRVRVERRDGEALVSVAGVRPRDDAGPRDLERIFGDVILTAHGARMEECREGRCLRLPLATHHDDARASQEAEGGGPSD